MIAFAWTQQRLRMRIYQILLYFCSYTFDYMNEGCEARPIWGHLGLKKNSGNMGLYPLLVWVVKPLGNGWSVRSPWKGGRRSNECRGSAGLSNGQIYPLLSWVYLFQIFSLNSSPCHLSSSQTKLSAAFFFISDDYRIVKVKPLPPKTSLLLSKPLSISLVRESWRILDPFHHQKSISPATSLPSPVSLLPSLVFYFVIFRCCHGGSKGQCLILFFSSFGFFVGGSITIGYAVPTPIPS